MLHGNFQGYRINAKSLQIKGEKIFIPIAFVDKIEHLRRHTSHRLGREYLKFQQVWENWELDINSLLLQGNTLVCLFKAIESVGILTDYWVLHSPTGSSESNVILVLLHFSVKSTRNSLFGPRYCTTHAEHQYLQFSTMFPLWKLSLIIARGSMPPSQCLGTKDRLK